MIRRRTAVLLALGLLAPLTLAGAPAGAALQQDLVASATSGPPGTAITLTSASCAAPAGKQSSLSVSLFTGTGSDRTIAANSYGWDTGTTTVTVPDWVDPDQPAVIEATCYVYDDSGDGDSIDYDPIPFDVEPGSGTPVQVRTLSRTELLAGQGFGLSGSCGPDLANGNVYAIVAKGYDQGGFTGMVGLDFGSTDETGAFDFPVIVSNAAFVFSFTSINDEPPVFSTYEEPLDVPVGDYTVFTSCTVDGDQETYLEPGTISITGAAPTGGADIVQDGNTRNVTFTGTCAAGDVTGAFHSMTRAEVVGDEPTPDPAAPGARLTARLAPKGTAATVAGRPVPPRAIRGPGGSYRGLADEASSEFAAQPAADGSWSASDAVGFDDGFAIGIAYCGDPLADGYFYDPRGVEVVVEQPTTTVPTTTVPVPAPANAVPGTPTYAG